MEIKVPKRSQKFNKKRQNKKQHKTKRCGLESIMKKIRITVKVVWTFGQDTRYQADVLGDRVQGRPPTKMWYDEVAVILGKKDVTWAEARGQTQNKKRLTEFV